MRIVFNQQLEVFFLRSKLSMNNELFKVEDTRKRQNQASTKEKDRETDKKGKDEIKTSVR